MGKAHQNLSVLNIALRYVAPNSAKTELHFENHPFVARSDFWHWNYNMNIKA